MADLPGDLSAEDSRVSAGLPLPTDAPPQPRQSRAGRNLPAAIGVGVTLFAIVVVTLGWFNWGFVIFTAVALCFGAVELHRAMARIEMHSAIGPIVVGTLAIVVGAYAAGKVPSMGISSNTWLLASLGMTVLVSLMWRMRLGAEGFVKDAAASLFTIGYLPLLGAFVSLMMAEPLGPQRIVTYMLCVMANDIGGYAIGVWAGKHPMAPKISPKKSWEGFAGSVFFGALCGVLGTVYLLHAQWWVGLILGVVTVIFATSGDLIESLFKRDIGIKDMSNFLPGHGGVMDRLDSLLVAAPVAWLVLYLAV